MLFQMHLNMTKNVLVTKKTQQQQQKKLSPTLKILSTFPPKIPTEKKKKNVIFFQNFFVGQKFFKTRSSTAIVHPGAVATPPE